MDRPLLGVDRLGNAVQKHCCSSDVLASSSEVWEIVPLIHGVMLYLVGVTPGAACRVMRMGRNVLHRAQVAASSAAVVIAPRRALVRAQGPPHEGPEGCESARTPLPPAAIPERPP